MTFSILVCDRKTGVYGAAAATGSLCVGGWVLRGAIESGLSASQGTSPSTLWGEDVLTRMRAGQSAAQAVADTIRGDTGQQHRQLAALSPDASAAGFTGDQSIAVAAHTRIPDGIVAGNMLANSDVLPAIASAFGSAQGPMETRLLAALKAGHAAGGDSRGLMSAALLVLARDRAPVTLRIDSSRDPLADLDDLLGRVRSSPYADWARQVPNLDDPFRVAAPAGDRSADGSGAAMRSLASDR